MFLLVLLFTVMRLADCGHVSEFTIPEEQPSRTFVGSVRSNPTVAQLVNTADSVRFSLRYSTGIYLLFSIDDKTGEIWTARRIDREQLCTATAATTTACVLSLDVVILPIKYYQIIKVLITVTDINDNSPTFPQSRLAVEIKENAVVGTSVSIPAAEDNDGESYGVQRYSMSSPDSDLPFQLVVTENDFDETKDLWIRLIGRLDRELRDLYQVVITAYDGGQPARSGSVTVDITVVDTNDNSPVFDSSVYDVQVTESQSPGSILLRVHATDADQGRNADIQYKLADQSQSAYGKLFVVNSTTGEIYLLDYLDYELQSTYQLTVTAADQGLTASLPTYARVTIHVLDENDNAPNIVVNSLTESGRIELAENSEVSAFLAYIAVNDLDSDRNALVHCNLAQNASSLFRLDSVSNSEYKLVALVRFDRERQSEYSISITCSDNGIPARSSSTNVSVFILDSNDNAPAFASHAYIFSVSEGNIIGHVIGQVNATDLDAGVNADLTYSVSGIDGTVDNAIRIDRKSGLLFASIIFDYERRREYSYVVTVRDAGESPRSATVSVIVQIVDVNDEKPVFDKTAYYFTIAENKPIGAIVGSVHAVDADISPAYSSVTYTILQTSNTGVFEVDPTTGLLTTRSRLDREQHPVYELSIRASNFGFSDMYSTVPVTVYIEDVNDNAPVVKSHRHLVHVTSHAPAGTLVTRLDASDADDGANAALSYSIANGNEDGLFIIDEQTGAVTTARQLHFADSKTYKLVLTVHDHGTPQKVTVVDLLIAVNSTVAYSDNGLGSLISGLDNSKLTLMVSVVAAGLVFVTVLMVVVCLIICRWKRRNKTRGRQEAWLQQQSVQAAAAAAAASSASGNLCSACNSVSNASGRLRDGGQSATSLSDCSQSMVRVWSSRATDVLTERGDESQSDDEQTTTALLDNYSAVQPASLQGSFIVKTNSQSQHSAPDVIKPAAGPTAAAAAIGLDRKGQRSRRHRHRRSAACRSPGCHKPLVNRRPYQRPTKSDYEMSDRGAGDSDCSEFSESTTCRDSGMDPSEDSDHLANTVRPVV